MPQLTTSYWPADTSVPLPDTTIGSVLRDAAKRAAGTTALIDGDPDPGLRREWTYAEMLAEAERAARALLGHFEPGEKIAVWAANSPQWVLLEFAAALAGLTLVTVNPAYYGAELEHVLGHSQASGLFRDDMAGERDMAAVLADVRGGLPRLRSVFSFGDWERFVADGPDGGRGTGPDGGLPRVAPDDPAQILYTSGTTGRPKGAVLTHRGLTANAWLAGVAEGARHGDVGVSTMPLFHVAGAGLMTLGLAQLAGTNVMMPRFSPGLQLELIETYRAVMSGGVPTMLLALLNHPDLPKRDLSTLRYMVTGGSSVPGDLVRQAEEKLGCPLLTTFGQTEAHCSVTFTTPADAERDRAGTVGRPIAQAEVKVADLATGETVPPGAEGEVCARGFLVMREYLHDPDATAAAVDSDGWLHTGDVGSMDERGYLRISGRVKEMIIRGGENIYPREIESVLLAHPAVLDASVVGLADEYYGEIVGAAIRPRPEAAPPDPAELARFCRGRLADYKIPVRWLIVEEFPLTASGKIRKDVLSNRIADSSGMADPSGEIQGR